MTHAPNPFAFPDSEAPQPGMSLKDYFAAAALTGILAGDLHKGMLSPADTAEAAYNVAEHMLEEREKRNA